MKPHLHFMGIGGVGMSGLARHYHTEGYLVSGCDIVDSSEVRALRELGIQVALGHSPEHLTGVQRLISSMAVADDNPEIAAAKARGLDIIKRIELLAELVASRLSIGVTGTHGKSTTTGMIASLLIAADEDPSVLLGAHLKTLADFGGNVRYGRGPRLICEVDESDPGFAQLRCDLAVITSLEDDHIAGGYQERRNYHASLAELEAATQQFAEQAATVLYSADWPTLAPLVAGHQQAFSYGLTAGADYRATDLVLTPSGSSFTLVTPSRCSLTVQLSVPGRHNVQNATAALAVTDLVGLDPTPLLSSLRGFTGVGRRWQRHGSVRQALIIDDYAHHPTEVGVALEAARHTGRRIRAVLQPHRWVRTALHWSALADAVSQADEIIVLDIYGAGEVAIPGISSELIVKRLQAAGKAAAYFDLVGAQRYLSESLQAGDLVITLGAGDVWKVAAGIVAQAGGDDGSA
jgi:UDP-N-acetylmuramate--alanine ligase